VLRSARPDEDLADNGNIDNNTQQQHTGEQRR
jgi:hypothetical protein